MPSRTKLPTVPKSPDDHAIPTHRPCAICAHSLRLEIETALLAGQPVDAVAVFYGVDIAALRKHREMCATHLLYSDELEFLMEQAGRTTKRSADARSLQARIGLGETDSLSASLRDMVATQVAMGKVIRKHIDDTDTPEGIERLRRVASKSVMEAYSNVANAVRQNVEALDEIERKRNPSSVASPLSGLEILAGALTRSSHTSQ